MSDAERLHAAHAAYKAAHGTPQGPAAYRELERVVESLRAQAQASAQPAPRRLRPTAAALADRADAIARMGNGGAGAGAHGAAPEAVHAR